jgi:signal transduction histidine kinase
VKLQLCDKYHAINRSQKINNNKNNNNDFINIEIKQKEKKIDKNLLTNVTTSSKYTISNKSCESNESIINNQNDLESELYLYIEIEDTGIGLNEIDRNNLFQPFKQAQRLAGGTGLGLFSLAKRLDALKGFYGVEKRRDGLDGSLFWFAIPYKPDHSHNSNILNDESNQIISFNDNNNKNGT